MMDRRRISCVEQEMRLLVLVLSLLLPAVAVADRPAVPTTTRAVLLDDSKPAAGCGYLEVWTILHFDGSADARAPRGTGIDPKHLAVAVPCTELTRPSYSKTAGNAGVLAKGKAYVLTVDGPRIDTRWGKKAAFEAKTIDDVP